MNEVRPGQRLAPSATAWNRHERVAQAYERGDLGSRRDPTGGAFDPSVIWIQNKTGAQREQFEIVKLGDPVILPSSNEDGFRQQVLLEGIATTTGCQFAVLLEPAAIDDVVKAKIAGVIQSQITKTTTAPAVPLSLKVVAGEYKLKQASGGSAAQAIWAESGEGVKWAYVQLGQAAGKPPLIAYLNEDLLAGLSASAHLYDGNPGALSLSSEAVKVWDGIMDPGDYMAAGSRVWVEMSYGGELFVLVPYCSPTGTAPPPVVTNPPEEQEPPPMPPDWNSPWFFVNYPTFVEEYSGTPPFSSGSDDYLVGEVGGPPIPP